MSKYEKFDNNWLFNSYQYREDLRRCDLDTLKLVLKDREEIVKFSQCKLEIVKEVIKEKS